MSDFFDSETFRRQWEDSWVKMGIREPKEGEKVEYAISVPGVDEVIHLMPRAKISADEMEAHRVAQRRKMPSPLSKRQLDYLAWKKEVFWRIKKSATPEELRKVGWYLNQVENVGDMMTATYWGGKGILYFLSKFGLKMRGPAAKYMGWAILAKDITDMVNMFKAVRTLRGMKKKNALKNTNLNPFSNEAKLSRGFKLKAKLPGVPDWIEIAQVIDQFFGVGISFGAIVGFAQDLAFGLKRGAKIVVPKFPAPEQNNL